jgi:hypothetical protein
MVQRLFVVLGEKGNREKRAAADAEGRAARVAGLGLLVLYLREAS